MELVELAKTIRSGNASKGFDPKENLYRHLLLIISEICEAQEELRSGKAMDEIYYEFDGTQNKPCGFSVEIADAIIRILDLLAAYNLRIRPIGDKVQSSDDVYTNLLDACYYVGRGGMEPYLEKGLNKSLGLLLALCTKNKLDVEEIIRAKLAYNATRPHKHGRQF